MTHIIHPTADGVAITTPTGEVPIEQVAQQVAPNGIYAIVTADQIPSDRTFRAAWVYSPDGIEIDLDRAKAIAHDIRRRRRADELAPHDRVISLKIPGASADKAEAARAAIRTRYNAMQDAIDSAASVEDLQRLLSPQNALGHT
jgi:hypothetical protein